MTWTAAGSLYQATSSTFTLAPSATGNMILMEVIQESNNTVTATALSSSNVTWAALGSALTGSVNVATAAVFVGTVTSTSSATVTVTWSGATPATIRIAGREFHSSGGAWAIDGSQGNLDSAGTSAWPSLTPAGPGRLYWGFVLNPGTAVAGSTTGYTYELDAHSNGSAFNLSVSSATHPVWTDTTEAFGIVVLMRETTHSGAATLSGVGTLGATGHKTVPGHASLAGVGTMHAANATFGLVKATTGGGAVGTGSTITGPNSIVPGNAAGNLLVLFAAWDVSSITTSGNGVVPSGAVADSERNWWRSVADTGSTVPGCRMAAYVCANALAITRWLSFTPQGYAGSCVYFLLEFSGMPSNYWPLVDFSSPLSSLSASSLNVPGTASGSDFCFTAGAVSTNAITPVLTGAGWTTAATGSQTLTSAGIAMTASFGAFPAGSVPASWGFTSANQVAAITFGLTQASHLPTQINPNFPRVFVEAAFGKTPGDPTKAILDSDWTDLSAYATGEAGQTSIETSRGKQYELAQPESGTLTIGLNNQSGAFNPSNASSPFWPNIVPGVPVRVSAQFGGRRYPVGSGYVERWPQDWPDMPQWGWSKLVATDTVGVASALNLPSSFQGEIFADEPYLCFPFNEQYSSAQNTLNGPVKSSSPMDGQLAVNTARLNQKTATYTDGVIQSVATGLQVASLGASDTGMGTTGYNALDLTGNRGPGAQYGPDTGMPALAASGAGDFSLEFLFQVPFSYGVPATDTLIPLFELLVAPYLGSQGAGVRGAGSFIIGGYAYNADATITFSIIDSWSGTLTRVTGLGNSTQHLFIVASGGNLTSWWDGASTGVTVSGIPYPAQLTGINFGLAISSYGGDQSAASPPTAGGNYTLAYCALYPYALPPYRLTRRASSFELGFAAENFSIRSGRYMAWTRTALGLAGPGSYSDSLLLGPAYATAGSSLAAALNADSVSSGGSWLADARGNLVILPRTAQYNRVSRVTFGDAPLSGEIPYEPDAAFDYDNTYISNSVQVSITQGPNSLAVPLVRDQTSVGQYLQRGPLQQSVSVQNSASGFDRAWWSLNKFKQPALRVRSLTVRAARTPASFNAILATDISDAATVNRRPLTQGQYSLPVIVGKVTHTIGPGTWDTTYQMYPNVPEGTILVTDTPGNNALGSNALAW